MRAAATVVPVLAAALLLAGAPARASDEQPIRCEFGAGLRAVYIVAPAQGRVRRPDVRPVRTGRLEVEPDEYRFVFEPFGGLRSVTVIDRGTGAARRVFGTRARMERSFAGAGRGDGLVREAGLCRVRFGGLR